MLLASGSIRNEELGAIVLYSDLCECFPYDDEIILIKVSGAQLKRMIKYMVRDEVWEGVHSGFYQFSDGMKVRYSLASHEFTRFDLNGEADDDNKIYRIGLQSYHFKNLEEFFSVSLDEVSKNGKPMIVSTSCRTILDEYLSSHQNLDRLVSGRLVIE